MNELKVISWDDDKQYSLVTGGLIYTVMSKLKFFDQTHKGLMKTALFFGLITWLPLLFLTMIDGTITGAKVEINFLEDFLIHTKLLLIVPFLILIERLIDSDYDGYVNSIWRMVRPEKEDRFELISARIDRLSNSLLPEILFLMIIYAVVFLISESAAPKFAKWDYLPEGSQGIGFTIAGWYELLISMPVYQLLIFRWIWRWLLWAYSVFMYSRLNLRINGIHADQMAGMEFLNILPLWFGILSISLSVNFAAQTGMEIIYGNASLKDFVNPIIGYVAVLNLFLYLPLLFFVPALIKAKTKGIYYYGGIAQYHNNLFNKKWLKGELPKDEKLLGSIDNSSLADLNGAYQQSISEMNIIPINFRWMMGTALVLLVPFLPLLGTYYSMGEFLEMMSRVIFGGL